MSLSRTTALVRHNFGLLLADPSPILITTLMRLVLMGFLQGMSRSVLNDEGFGGATGAEHVVPGMAVLFSLFGVIYLGMAFFQEHGWSTWERLRSSQAGSIEILLGKMIPSAVVVMAQTVMLFIAGGLMFGLQIAGSILALVAMIVTTTVFLVALSMLCVALFRTINQLSAAANVGAMILGGFGGALAPISALPDWAQTVAPLSPTYWALLGFRSVILEGGGVQSILVPMGILVGVSLVAAGTAAYRFRFTDAKVWA